MAYYSVSPVNFESVSATTATPSVDPGTRRSEGVIDYVYVYNACNSQLSKGQHVNIRSISMNSGFSVSITNAASQAGSELVVGVVHNATIATGYYGWVATRGPVYIALDGSEISMDSGNLIALGIDGGFVSAPATIATSVRLGVCLNSCVTTVGTGKAMFRSPLYG